MKTTKDTNNFNLENWVIKTLKSDPELAQEYITQAVDTFNKENNIDSLIYSLEKIIQAKGKDYFEKESDIKYQDLYKELSKKGNPRIKTFIVILDSLGYRLNIY